MEAESNHSRQNQPPIMMDVSTGHEYLNGERLDPPLEVILFKFRPNHEASLPSNYSGESHCDLTQCFCDESSRMENAEMFCESLKKIAVCRARMCPYTVDNFLKDELFGVLFEWLEFGDDWDPREGIGNNTNERSIPNNNTNHETRQQSSSLSSDDNSDERLPEEEVLNELSPISSTTSPPAPCAEHENTSNSNSAQTRSTSNNPSRHFLRAGLGFKKSALELVRRMDVDDDNASSEPEISQVHNESRESEDNTSVVEDLPETVAPESTELSQESELPSTTDKDDIQTSCENQANQNPELAVNEEPEPETQQKATSSHHIDDSPPPECPNILTNLDAQAAAVAVSNVPDVSPAGDVTSAAALSSIQSDNNADYTDNESVASGPVIEKVAEPSNALKSNSINTPKQKTPPANESRPQSPSQPPEPPKRRWEENEGTDLASTQRKSSFDSSGDCARVRSWLKTLNTTSVNISDIPENDKQTPASEVGSECDQELEEGEIDSQEDAQDEVPKQAEAPVDKTTKATISTDKRITRSGTNSPVPFQSAEEGVRTRSRSSVAGPASVKRDRESRAAKKSAQSKISSLLGVAVDAVTNEENSVTSSPVTDSTATAGPGLRKRLRASESTANQSDDTSNQHQTRSTVNKSLSRKRPKILQDETSSDVPSSSSRSSTPSLDEANHPETRSRQERRSSSSPSPVATRQSQKNAKVLEKPQTKTSTEKSSTEEEMITNAEDSDSSDSDESSSSDSGESHVSEIPLAERLEKKRKREDKERRKALKGNKTLEESRSRKSERKRKKRHGLSLTSSENPTSTLQSKLPFRIPDLPTNAKKAEACKSTTSSILQAAKSQNLLQQQKRTQVETEAEKVVTINDDDDDDILMIQEVEVPKKTTSTPTSSTFKRSNSTECSTSTQQPSTIRISLSKDKSKGPPQRSLSIPGTSPTNTPNNELASPDSTRIELGKPLVKSTSLPLSTPAELNITPSAEVDLEDHSRWEFPQNTSPRKTPKISLGLASSKTNETLPDKSKSQPFTLEKIQPITLQLTPEPLITITGKESTASKESTAIPSTSQKPAGADAPSVSKKPTETPSTNKDPKAAPSITHKIPTLISSSPIKKSSFEHAKQVSPSKNSSNDQDQTSRLRTRKQTFDPKAEAAKPIPKPVPKVTKEIIQQQQVSKSVSGPTPSSSISKTASITTTASSSTPQKEGSNLPTKNKEPTTQPTPQKTPEKTQQQQQDKHGRASESSTRKETVESTSTSRVSTSAPAPQRDRSQSPQVIPQPKPAPMSASFVDGEIRLLPNKPSTSSTSPTSGSSTSGTWRRGVPTDNRREKEVDFTDDSVDFETPPPDDEDDRRRSSSRGRDRDRNRSGESSRSSSSSSGGANRNNQVRRGGSHQQPYHFQGPPRGGGGPPRQQFYDGGGRGHPRQRPPFSGGPRANMIGTVVSHGRYQNPEEFTQDFCPGMPHPNQFPPPPFEMQFNPQLGPPQGMFPRMGGPPPPLFPNQQFPPRWPRYRM